MSSNIADLGGLSIFHAHRIEANLSALRRYARFITQENSGPHTTWEALLLLMHPELKDVPKGVAGPLLVRFDGNNERFRGAAEGLLRMKLTEAHSYHHNDDQHFDEQFSAALSLISKKLPSLWPFFVDLISYVIIAKKEKYAGGTVSSRVGLIWISPNANWTIEQWADMLVHEFIHNILFVEDMVRCLFVAGTERLAQSDVASQSAIRQEKRGYDKSYHSAFVAFGLINFYLSLEQVVTAKSFLDPLIICVEDLLSKSKLASETGRAHVAELAEAVLEIRQSLFETSQAA